MFKIDAAWDRPAKISNQTSEHILRLRLSSENHLSASGIPLRLAIALDTSTSMHGEKLEQAKTACQMILSQQRTEDQLSLASFATTVTPLKPNQTAINQLNASGITRTDLALDWLHTTLPPEKNTVRVAILIPDGHATNLQGHPLEDLDSLLEQSSRFNADGILLYTVGLGDAANFNTGFLNELSERARGSFLYADTPATLESQLRDRLTACQAIAIEEAKLIFNPSSGVTVQSCCCLRPEYVPLEESSPGEVPLNGLRSNCPTDILVALTVPPAGSEDAHGSQTVLEVRLTSASLPPLTHLATLNYTQSYREAQQINEAVNRDRLTWEINRYSSELTRTNNPNRTGELLTKIQVAALKSGCDDIAQQAHQQQQELEKTGTLTPHHTATLHQATRNLLEDTLW